MLDNNDTISEERLARETETETVEEVPLKAKQTPSEPSRQDVLRSQIAELVAEYHSEAFPARAFAPGETTVPVSGKVFDAEDIQYLVDSSLDFWLTTGRFALQFEREFAKFCG